MRIFTKSLLVLVMLCIAGVMSAKKVVVQEGVKQLVRTIDYGAGASYGWNQCPSGASLAVQDGCLVIDNTSTDGDFYTFQFFAFDGVPYHAGSTYELRITYKFVDGDDNANNNAVWLRLGSWDGTPTHYGVSLPASDEFTTKVETWENYYGDVNGGLMWQSRGVLGTFYVKKFEIYEVNPKTIEYEWVDVNVAEAYKKEHPSTVITNVPIDGEIVVESPAKVEGGQEHDTQFWIKAKQAIPAGTVIKLSFEYKASSAQNVGTQCHEKPGNYIHWQALSTGYEDFGTNWKTYDQLFTIPSQCDGKPHMDGENYAGFDNNFQSIAFNLTKDAAMTYYFRNIKIQLDNDDIIDELRPEYRPETAVSVDVEINDTDPAIVAKKTALLTAINRGKDADRTNKTKASMKALDDAIEAGYKLFAPEAQKKTITVTIPVTVKQDLTFKTEDYCTAQWTEADKTLSWGTGGWGNPDWTFMAAQNVSGDVKEWTKMHLKATDFVNSKENKLKVVFKENDGSNPPAGPTTEFVVEFGEDGVAEIDLAAADWKCDRTKLQDLTVYGMERTDATVAATVKVTEAWLEKKGEDKVEDQVVDKSREEILAQLTAGAQAIRVAIINLEDRPAPAPEAEVPAGWKSVIKNGTFETEDMSSFFIQLPDGEGLKPAVREDYAGTDDHFAAVVKSEDNPSTDWDTQIFFKANEMIPVGKKIHVEFDYRSDVAGQADTQCHNQPTQYIHWACVGSPNFTTEWQHYKYDTTVPTQCDGTTADGGYLKNFQTIAFNLSKNKKATTFYIDNVIFWVEDDATIINSVDAKAAGKGEYFDLQGRRVAQPGKGLYIKNGKVVLVK